jgi:hypothetical protein
MKTVLYNTRRMPLPGEQQCGIEAADTELA